MRRFSPEYLDRTRRGMWDGDREALAPLRLSDRERVLDVGCGTGELTRVLAAEAPASTSVLGVDADRELLRVARSRGRDRDDVDRTRDRDDRTRDAAAHTRDAAAQPRSAADGPAYLAGDATRLPIADTAVDLVVCQALLINLPDPRAAIREFRRVSSDLVAAIEPNNADVGVSSTVDAEERLEREARNAYLDGVGTNVALGDRVRELFRREGIESVTTRRYYHEKRIEPPYADQALAAAARKASGAGLADHRAELEAALSPAGYDDLRSRWRSMGRDVVDAMRDREYERVEVVPFDVTVGRVGSA
ncbi:class I SAM-dependent methyltransferase [Halopenitus persicus]|uniref:class I SAM-dependent methyltransferase n=1 Tax=Halopenitus persicus TaxID=1048396 RepID=UPI000BBA63D4|nr:class I SAM-dependent methyltransferase [Halopenitus persicus]